MADNSVSAPFATLFDKPSVEALSALTGADFQRFITYVFSRAGYNTHTHPLGFVTGVDLDLTAAGDDRKHRGVVSIKYCPLGESVSGQLVKKLQRSPAMRKEGAFAYVVTNGSYDKSAYEQARRVPNTFLVNGEQFCRYVRYVARSRFPEGIGLTVVIPPDLFAGEGSLLQSTPDTHVLVFANNKGGVGKTTSTRQFALHMARQGLRVLLIDMDPQQNLSEGLVETGATHSNRKVVIQPSLVQYFSGQCGLAELVRPTFIDNQAVKNVAIIPSHPELSLLDTGGAGRPAVEARFARDLSALLVANGDDQKPYDWVIIDTPPAISLFTRAALCAADFVIAPARARPSSVAGIKNMFNTLGAIDNLRGRPALVLGCLLTHWQEDQQSTEMYPRLETEFDTHQSRMLANFIPFDVTVEKTHGPTQNRATDAYGGATKEVLDYVQRNNNHSNSSRTQHASYS